MYYIYIYIIIHPPSPTNKVILGRHTWHLMALSAWDREGTWAQQSGVVIF